MSEPKEEKIEWKLNAQNSSTKDEKLTRAVQEVIDLNDENRMDILADHFGAEALNHLIEIYGEPTRAMGLAMIDGRAVILGDCACRGANCRAAWGWKWNAHDLDMTGHRGSLWAEPCSSAKPTLFDPNNGMMYAAPWGMDPQEFYRYQRKDWGDTDKIGLQNFMNANVASAENKKYHNGDWVVDQ